MTAATKVAWGLWTAFVVALVGATYVGFNPPAGEPIGVIDAIWAASFVGFPTAGALVVRRYPRRALGWLLTLAPLLLMVGVLCSEVARYGLRDPSFPGVWFEWVGRIVFSAGLSLLLMSLLFLPNGLLLSRRWRVAVWPLALYAVVGAVFAMFGPWKMDGGLSNPIAVPALEGPYELFEAGLGVVAVWALGLGLLSLILRFKRSSGIERQQVKMLAIGAVGVAASFLALATTEAVLGDQSDFVATLFIIVAILALPVSIAMAVLRHRLYDIDLIVNRTLVYTALTAVLGLTYLGIVVVLQRLLAPITAESDLTIAASTLAVAALFRPLRAQVQGFIDRRFYRRKYDAAETLREFSARLRDQMDLDTLSIDLVHVVGEVMQPTHASVWLRPAEETS